MLNKFILGMISCKSGWIDNWFSTNADWATTWYKKNIIYWRSSIVRVRGWQYSTIFNKNWKVIPTVLKDTIHSIGSIRKLWNVTVIEEM